MENSIDQQTIQEGKTNAIIAYITLVGFIIAFVQNGDKKNAFTSYHIRQSLGIMVTLFALVIVGTIIGMLSIMGGSFVGLIGNLITWGAYILVLVLWVLGIMNANNGKATPVPLLGQLYEKWFANIQR